MPVTTSEFQAYLREVSRHGQNQGSQGRKGLEGSQIRIGSVSKRREWKLSHSEIPQQPRHAGNPIQRGGHKLEKDSIFF